MKPRILVLYYSQSGQLRTILNHLLQDVSEEASIDYALITPQQPWPWPWKTGSFFDAMPECVAMQPAPVCPLSPDVRQAAYDLVVLGWQPWFLHPSQPVTAFLQSEDAKMLAGKPVVTVVGCRNMWLNAGEKVKELLAHCGARQVGNIVLTDTNPNLVSLLTIIRWAFSGQKERSRWLPEAGVQARDLIATSRFGKPLLEAAQMPETHTGLHEKLVSDGAVPLNTSLVLLEQRGIKNFRYWSRFIREKGAAGAPERQGRVRLFKRLLITAIFILSPISSLTAFLQERLQRKRLLDDVAYFKSLRYEPGRI